MRKSRFLVLCLGCLGVSVCALPAAGQTVGHPDTVRVTTWIVDLDKVDSRNQTFSANVFIALEWRDPGLAGWEEMRTMPLTAVWNPNVQIANEGNRMRKTFPEVVQVTPQGDVSYRQRYVGEFSQHLDLRDFPFDHQRLRIQLVAPGFRPNALHLVPAERVTAAGKSLGGGVAAEVSVPDWIIEDWTEGSSVYVTFPGLEVAGYSFDLRLRRAAQHYMLKVILPLVLIVMMSWGVFWIDPALAAAQISVAVTSMLTLIAYRFAVDAQVPNVPYTTRLDHFLLGSTFLVFLTLLQALITSRISQRNRHDLGLLMDRWCRVAFPMAFGGLIVWSLFL